MAQIIRIHKADKDKMTWEVLYPMTSSMAVERPEGGLQEDYNLLYDDHIVDNMKHVYRATSSGMPSTISVYVPNVTLEDQLAVIIKLHTDLSSEPVLSFNGEPAANIIASDGANISGGQIAGTSIMVIWLAEKQKWLLVNNDLDNNTTHAVLPVVSYYTYTAELDGETTIPVSGYDRTADKLDVNYHQTILMPGIDYTTLQDNSIMLLHGMSLSHGDTVFLTVTKFVETIRRGFRKFSLDTSNVRVEIAEDQTQTLAVPEFGDGDYELIVNLNQTILREGIDYERDFANRSINLLGERYFYKGDNVVYTISRYVEELGNIGGILPSVGQYEQIIKPIYESFTATVNGTTRIIVPSYDPYRDDLVVVRDNLVLVGSGVDYSETTDGEIILLHTSLNEGDVIYFRILKGLKIESTPYTIVNGTGDGKDILVSISDGALWDNYTLCIKMPADMEDAPTIKFLDGPARDVLDSTGEPMHAGAVIEGAYLLVNYNESAGVWYAINANAENTSDDESGISTFSMMKVAKAPAEANNGPIASGISNFSGKADKLLINDIRNDTDGNPIGYYETVVAHNLGYTPTDYRVNPIEPPSALNNEDLEFDAYIGDVWITADENNLYIGNSGNATSKFQWFIYR